MHAVQTKEMNARMDALAAAFRSAEERMRGLPVHNPALVVEIVEMRSWRNHYIGILITPWCMNLVVLPQDRAAIGNPAAGTKRDIELPCGMCTFLAGDVSFTEPHWACSLFSPVLEFTDQAMARAIAGQVMSDVLSPPERGPEEAGGRQAVTRRELLRGPSG